ncbi:uncharacterized protein BDR25DRAFT_308936 [Lindgomyces ingoldianus]|uniref:Uncharacterized protein n=1 Tax=Lindgomyces ingoldianus TaxID=673940 RepID=A0ACB6RGF4_9PLEO|nr:uncharacterized protein BDR25DRAFT_308936 [Lindgomyces ingoldianus]KAF2478125.1 hypothetical protein BDR25DRAFT_308936 [Lindgomyces ingoldianus]
MRDWRLATLFLIYTFGPFMPFTSRAGPRITSQLTNATHKDRTHFNTATLLTLLTPLSTLANLVTRELPTLEYLNEAAVKGRKLPWNGRGAGAAALSVMNGNAQLPVVFLHQLGPLMVFSLTRLLI